MKFLLSSGLSGPLGLKAGDQVRWYGSNNDDNIYLGTVRGLITKLPGFQFSGLNAVVAFN